MEVKRPTLSKNFIEFVNNYLFSNFNDHLWLNRWHQTNDFDSDADGSINFRTAYQNNPLIGYINILFVDKTKLDASFPDLQFKMSGYQFPRVRRDHNSKGRGEIVLLAKALLWNN